MENPSAALHASLTKNQVCFFHIPKTAGSTVLELLRTQFGTPNVFHAREPQQLTRPIAHLLLKHPVIAGHFFARYLSNDILSKVFIFTFLRNPLERVLSQYSYYRRLPADIALGDPGVALAQRLGIKEILAKHTWKEVFSPWSNLQTAIFSGCNTSRPATNEALERAKHNLEQLDFVGLYEDLHRGLDELFLRLKGSQVLEIPTLNKTTDRLQLEALDGDTRDLLAEYNQLDQALFVHAQKLWRERHAPAVEAAIITDLTENIQHGTREIIVTSIALKEDRGSLQRIAHGQPWSIIISGRSFVRCADFTVGILISDEAGGSLYGTNSWLRGRRFEISPDRHFTVEIEFPAMLLAVGRYNLTVSFHTGRDTAEKCFTWMENVFQFSVFAETSQDFIGVTNLDARFSLIPDPI